MKFRFSLGAIVALALLPFLAIATDAAAQAPKNISMTVGVCDPLYGQRCVKPDANGAIPTTGTSTITPGAAIPSTNGSSTVTAGGTYQTVFAASTARRGCTIQNPTTATEVLNVRVKSAAVFTLSPGSSLSCGAPGLAVISDLVEVTAATTGHAFTALSQ